jgi:REP element-mobilizing transposase RayT
VTVEVVSRTVQGRYLLRPSSEVNETVLGILGRALVLHPVQVHAYAVLSNHYHMLLTAPDAAALSSFMGYLNRETSRRIGILHEWSGGIWAQRYDSTPILGEGALVARLRYVTAQGVKEGLVERCLDWPGVSSTRSLLEGVTAEGRWLHVEAFHRARKRNPLASREAFIERYPIELAPLPCWIALSSEARREAVANLVEEIERDAAEDRRVRGCSALGAAWICGQHPHHRPAAMETTPSPLVHASTAEQKHEFLELRRGFIDAYRRASKRLRDGDAEVRFPPHAFPCPARFVGTGQILPVSTVEPDTGASDGYG